MRILNITAWGAPADSAWAPEYNLALEEARLGHDVTIFTFGLNLNNPKVTKDGSLEIVRFPYFVGGARMVGPYRVLTPKPRAIPLYLTYLERWRGDIVHLHFATSLSILSSLWLKIRRKEIPIVMTNHDPFIAAGLSKLDNSLVPVLSSILSPRTILPATSNYLSSIPFRLADQIIVFTEFEKRILASQGLLTKKINVIPNGVNFGRLFRRRPSFCSTHGIPKPMVLNVGRFVQQKGQRYLIEAIPGVLKEKETHFVFIGHQQAILGELKQLAEHLNVAKYVHFYESVSESELAAAYNDCDIFAFPSLFESFGMALVEAMAIGKPVIAFNVCGMSEILEGGKCGILVPPGDVYLLATALIKLLQSEEERVRLGEAARMSATGRYDWGAVGKRVVELYENIRHAEII